MELVLAALDTGMDTGTDTVGAAVVGTVHTAHAAGTTDIVADTVELVELRRQYFRAELRAKIASSRIAFNSVATTPQCSL